MWSQPCAHNYLKDKPCIYTHIYIYIYTGYITIPERLRTIILTSYERFWLIFLTKSERFWHVFLTKSERFWLVFLTKSERFVMVFLAYLMAKFKFFF